MAAHQASPSLGFSRQEHWSGLPFPSPMYEIKKWKWSRSVVSDSLWPRGLQPTRLLHPWDFPGKSTGVGCHFLLQGIFLTQGLSPHLLTLAGRFFSTESPGKPIIIGDMSQTVVLKHQSPLQSPAALLRCVSGLQPSMFWFCSSGGATKN